MTEKNLLRLTQKLLDSIALSDYDTYSLLCSEEMTMFEPEAKGTLVQGKDFHKWYFDQHKLQQDNTSQQQYPTKAHPCCAKVRMLGSEAAVVTYIRLDQCNYSGYEETRKSEETRVWQLIEGGWRVVHTHRSSPS